ncbi:MAG: hypothetical protein ACT4QF_25560 [Sporichthyaceae bacterium]
MQWFVFPVEGGLELVVDSTDELVLESALADIAAVYPNHLIAREWVLESGDVISLVPASVEAVPTQRIRSAEEEKSRAAHPAGRGRKI